MRICHITLNSIDLERRIFNQAESAHHKKYDITIVAHGKRDELLYEQRPKYTLIRIRTGHFRKGPFKFLIFNFKTTALILRKSFTIIHCHDLWTLPAAAVVSLLRKSKLIYDAHEYYAGLEIFLKRPVRKKIWTIIERLLIDQTDILFTVSEPLAELYRQRYPALRRIELIRNLPALQVFKREESGKFPKHLVFQGHFKPGRGLEYLFHALRMTEDVHLTLIGGGELQEELERLRHKLDLTGRIHFTSYIPPEDLVETSAKFTAGVVLFQPTSLNYAFALPNKFFEYLMAGLPVLASNIDTLKEYVLKYDVGVLVDAMDISAIAAGINELFAGASRLQRWRKNAREAARELNWDIESVKLIKIYEEIIHS